MNEKRTETRDLIKHLKQLSVKDFEKFGLHQIAYIKPITHNGAKTYAIHGADGENIKNVKSLDLAIVTAKQNDLDPVTLH